MTRVTPAQLRRLQGKGSSRRTPAKRNPISQEKHVLKAVLDYLKVEGIWAMRVNSGIQVIAAGAHARRVIRAAPRGTADVLAIIPTWRAFRWKYLRETVDSMWCAIPLWIEVKSADGQQTQAQREFQQRMERDGALYCLARSVSDVMAVIPPKGAR